MTTSYTPRLGLPEMADGEGSGYVTFNDMGRMLDGYVQTVIQSRSITDPPGSPSEGQIWYVPSGATGAWVGNEGKFAQWYNGQWWFYLATYAQVWIIDEEWFWVVDRPLIGATMALEGTPPTHTITATAAPFDVADVSLVAPKSPNPTTIDMANSRFTVNDYVNDVPIMVSAQASLDTTASNNVTFGMIVYKNGVAESHLRAAYTATNQAPNASLVISGSFTVGKDGDQFELRFFTDGASISSTFQSFSFTIIDLN